LKEEVCTGGEGGLAPGFEGVSGGLDGGVEVLVTGYGDFVERGVGCWVKGMAGCGSWYDLIVDDVAWVGLLALVGDWDSGSCFTLICSLDAMLLELSRRRYSEISSK
jgi:hypothetical protein